MSGVVIRTSCDADLPALHAIYAWSVQHEMASWEYEPPSLEEFATRRASIIAQGFPYLAAELEGAAVGYAYASSYRARIGYRFVVENSVYVAREVAGRGVGKALLHALIAACEQQGFRQMVAVIGDAANIRSIKLHEACGFRQVALFKSIGFKQGHWLDSVQMQRALGAGDTTPP